MAETKRQRPYKQVARAQAQEHTRETLLQAASEEVEQVGWTRASLEAVAERAGVTKQTALRHFGSKEGLLDAILQRVSSSVVKERAEAPIGDIPGAVGNLVRHYERYGHMVMRLLPYKDASLRVLGRESHVPFVHRAVGHGQQVHAEWVARTFEPQLSRLDAGARERRMAQLISVCDVYMWKILRRDLGMSIPAVEEALVELIERLVEPDAAQLEQTGDPPARKPPPGRKGA
jgi:AcrR family transcriptional regulator